MQARNRSVLTKGLKMKFTVLLQNVEILNDVFAKINKKAVKNGLETIRFSLCSDPYTNEFKEEVVDIEVFGLYPKIGNYKLVAVLENVEGGNLIKAVPGEELPKKYRENAFFCDHCGHNRYRKEVVVVRDVDSGEYKQVGKTCLKDFLGADLESIVSFFSYFVEEMEKASDKDHEYSFGYVPKVVTTERFMGVLCKVMRKVGYLSKKNAENGGISTSSLMYDILFGCSPRSESYRIIRDNELKELSDEDIEYGKEVLKYWRNIDGDSDFEYNMKLIMSSNTLASNRFGYASCTVAGYERYIEKENAKKKAKEESTSDWVGNLKERIEVEVECLASRTFDGYYGLTTMLRFIDGDGNIFVWFASGGIDWVDVGDKLVVKGTVKKHDEYNGVKQTVINRVKPVSVAV